MKKWTAWAILAVVLGGVLGALIWGVFAAVGWVGLAVVFLGVALMLGLGIGVAWAINEVSK